MKTFLLLLLLFSTNLALGQFTDAQKQYLTQGNLLENPGFENGKRGWSGGSALTATALNGASEGTLAGCQTITAAPLSLDISTTNKAGVLRGQGVSLLDIYSTFAGVQLCSVINGVVDENSCSTATTSPTVNWDLQLVSPFVFGSTSHGLRARTTGNVTGTFCADAAFIGRMPATMMPQMSQYQLIGESYWANAGCTPARTNTNYGAFTDDTDCTGPTVTLSRKGTWATTDANNLEQTVTNLPAGDLIAEFMVPVLSGAAADGYLNIFDGTSQCIAESIVRSETGYRIAVVKCVYPNFQGGSKTFELYGKSSSGSLTIAGSATGTGNAFFRLWYSPPPQTIYSKQSIANGWTNFTPTGSWVTNTTYTGKYRINNGMAEIQYQWNTSGAPTSASLTLNLPNSWVIDTSKLTSGTNYTALPTEQCILRDAAPAAFNCYAGYSSTTAIVVIVNEAGGTYVTANGVVTQAVPMTWASGDYGVITVSLPIVGISESMITGTFAEMMRVPNVDKPKTCYYAFGGASATLAAPTECTTGTCVEVYDSCGVFSPPTRSGAGVYTDMVLASGTFSNSSFLDCKCEAYDTTVDTAKLCRFYLAAGDSTWSTNSSGGATLNLATSDAASSDAYVKLKCEGLAP